MNSIERLCRSGLAGALLAALAGFMSPAAAEPVFEQMKADATMRVCIWPDCCGISFRNPRTQQLTGADSELAAQLAHDLQVRVESIDSSFQAPLDDVTSGRCDVAMIEAGRIDAYMTAYPYIRRLLGNAACRNGLAAIVVR